MTAPSQTAHPTEGERELLAEIAMMSEAMAGCVCVPEAEFDALKAKERVTDALKKGCYLMSEPHLSGYRLIFGFEMLEEVQQAHDAVARGLATQPSRPQGEEGLRAMDHAANEWADAFYNAVQWIKNIKNGDSLPDTAIQNVERCAEHCQATWAAAKALSNQGKPS